MAEGFARALGPHVLSAESAGLAPAPMVAPITREVMLERDIDLSGHFPKGLDEVDLAGYDLVVNLSGYPLPLPVTAPVREWEVPDPIGANRVFHERVARQVEELVRSLIAELARDRPAER
jgi:arsenate reductase